MSFAPHGAAKVNQIARIIKSRGIDIPRTEASIVRVSVGTWRVDKMTRKGVALPPEIFTYRNDKWSWRVEA